VCEPLLHFLQRRLEAHLRTLSLASLRCFAFSDLADMSGGRGEVEKRDWSRGKTASSDYALVSKHRAAAQRLQPKVNQRSRTYHSKPATHRRHRQRTQQRAETKHKRDALGSPRRQRPDRRCCVRCAADIGRCAEGNRAAQGGPIPAKFESSQLQAAQHSDTGHGERVHWLWFTAVVRTVKPHTWYKVRCATCQSRAASG
jgi:hypothetical protein